MDVNLRIDGVDHRAQAQLIKGTLWVHYNGRTFTVDTGAGQKSRRKAAVGVSSDQVLAPMPGKVTKIFVSPGAVIEQGQAVLVMEAMKMEYTLKAEVSGSVENVQCAVGEQVELGKTLVKIKSATDT